MTSVILGFIGGIAGTCVCLVVFAKTAKQNHENDPAIAALKERNQISRDTFERIDAMASDLSDIALSIRRATP